MRTLSAGRARGEKFLDRLVTIMDAQLGEHVLQVGMNGFRLRAELIGDCFIVKAFLQATGDLLLAGAEESHRAARAFSVQ
ncbi:hypothetical protein SBV1_3380004 [Verrucomicrobia bacterium]|nr:hypothetical protein SBV1_3380004 [Verrucomicrobiota bacterium]